MKKISKKTLILALSLILCFSVSIGVATAYFTDYEAAKGGAVLSLSGQTWVQEVIADNTKSITIKNVGETEMIVRVRIIGDATVTPNADWTKVTSNGEDWWYYTKILTPKGTSGDTSSTLVATVTGPEDVTNFDIIVVHESSRTVYDVEDGNTVLVKPNGWAYVPAVQ